MGQGGRRLGSGVVGVAAFVMVLGLVISGAFAATNSSSCSSSLTSLTPCLAYVSTGNTTRPGSDCCSPLGSLLSSSSDATCLCQLLSLVPGSSINETRALDLPSLCNLTVSSSVSSCLNATAPSTSPSTATSPPSQSDGKALSPFSLVVGSISLVVIYAMLTL